MTDALTRASLAARIDHTLLAPQATRAEVERVVAEAVAARCASVCVQPAMVGVAVEVAGGRVPVGSVVGFPHGATLSEVKAVEAAALVAQGAVELDMVADLGAIADADDEAVALDVARVRAAVPHVVLKVILESALWSDAELRAASEAAVAGGADFVKTSTGYHAAGGATVEAVALMRATVGRRARIKASGGIRTLEEARALLEAGADRLGMSATPSVLAQLGDPA
jgi:deoxyribose-phosphate aldolase